MTTIYKIINFTLTILTLISIELMLNSSILSYKVDMGIAYLAIGLFWLTLIISFVLDLTLRIKGEKVKLFKINYIIFSIFMIFTLINLMYNPVNTATYIYEPAQWYKIVGFIYNICFYGLILVKSICSLFWNTHK
ncbi:MAG: hypothetical protein RLZZ223_159 [Candidatus Parcubacteria bacterium]